MKINLKWDIYFLMEAALISTRSKDPSTKVGAVIISPNRRIISKGYNGLPALLPDHDWCYDDRDLKYETIIHGEENAILFAKQDLTGYYLYTWPFLPCSRCASKIIQVGIDRVVAPVNTVDRWKKNIALSAESLRTAGVVVKEYSRQLVIDEFSKISLDKQS
jgi:dCMP deaminase